MSRDRPGPRSRTVPAPSFAVARRMFAGLRLKWYVGLLAAISFLGLLAVAQQPADQDQLVTDFHRAEKLRTDGRFAEAAKLYESITAKAERRFGAESPDTTDLLTNRGLVLEQLGQYQQAQALYARCVRTARKRFPGDPRLPRYLTNLGYIRRLTGQLDQAERDLREALDRREKLGAGHEADIAESLHNLAVLLQEKGDLSAAEPLYQRCLKLRKQHLGATDPAVADTLNLMGQFYGQLGQHDRAEEAFRAGLKIRQDRFGPKHLATAASLNDFAVYLLNHGRAAEAEPLFRQALTTLEAQYGRDHFETAKAYHNLGRACLYLKEKRAEARQLLEQAMRVWGRLLPADHPTLALGLSSQARLHFLQGQDAEAEALARRALTMREKSLGRDHPTVVESLGQLADVLAAGGRKKDATHSFDQGQHLLRRYGTRVLPSLSEREQLAFLETLHVRELLAALSFAWRHRTDPELAELSAAWVLNGKGVAQEVLSARTLLLRDNPDPEVRKALAELADVRKQMSALALSAAKPEEYRKKQGQLAEQETALVKRLGQKRGPWADADSWVDLTRVRRALAKDTVLVEVARLPIWDHKARMPERSWLGPRYVAWIIPAAGQGAVRLVDLGEAGEIEDAVWRTRVALGRNKPLKDLRRELDTLARLVLRPIEEHAGNAAHWIISPDADLWLVPWSALPLRDGTYAIVQHRISYAVSGRDLTRSPDPTAPAASLVLADPDFDMQFAPPPGGPPAVRSGGLGNVRWQRLPGTAAEVEAIVPLLQKLTGSKPRVYTGAKAQAEIVKSAKRPHALVLSTHGFFLPDQITGPGTGRGMHRPDKDQPERPAPRRPAATGPRENPLLRCGLVFAGANRKNSSTIDRGGDGIMTGLEVIGIDLRGTKLVVLSACETGLGQVRNGEGVAGLRQAFQLAGAGCVVASLWQVPDRETAQLMARFWAELVRGRSKAEALRLAQLQFLQGNGQEAAHPFFWAAFTVTGQ